MASAFDPSAFIAAEEARGLLASVASEAAKLDTWLKPAEPCHFSEAGSPPLAAIAGIAAPRAILPWADDLLQFAETPCPANVRPEVWSELVEEAWAVSREWGQTALDAGWTSIDLFGCNPDPLAARVDRNGLVAMIAGLRSPVRIAGIDGQVAILTCQRGPSMRFRRPTGAGAVHLWHAYRSRAGP